MIDIVYAARGFVVVDKPFGMLSEGECPAAIAEALGVEAGEIYTVHRLDRTTAGLMVYARTKAAAAEISACIASGDFHKTYAAFVTAAPELPPDGEMRDFLFFDRGHDKAFVVGAKRRGAKEAVLRYETVRSFDFGGAAVSEMRVYPLTGRSHQIRVQFAARSSPIVGDGKYGSRVKYRGAALFSVGIKWKNFEFTLPRADSLTLD